MRLDLTNNEIVYLPPSFSRLTSLEICNLDSNRIQLSSNCFNDLKSIKQLNMKCNMTRCLYYDIGSAVSLELLDLSNNDVISLIPEIGLLTNLLELRLPYNKLTVDSLLNCPELSSCKSLQTLDISHNLIEGSIPDAFGLMRLLTDMNLSFNSINALPKSIIGLQEVLLHTCVHVFGVYIIDSHNVFSILFV